MRGLGRRRAGRLVRICAVVAAAFWSCESVVAAEQRVLPAFEVEAPEGLTVSSEQLSADAQWLMVYVSPTCAACDRLLELMAARQSPAAAARTVVIVAGERAAARAYVAARHGVAPAMRLYADVTMQAARALALSGSPSIVAIRRGQIEWVLTGVLNDPDALEPVIRAWVEY